jgi:outer membrane protein TolC
MYKNIGSVLCVYFCIGMGWTQTREISRILHEIEQNNKEIKAYSSWIESRKLALKSQNNLPDPQAGIYYLPWGEHQTGDYTEFQITQSFEFPTVYGARSKLIEQQQIELNWIYAERRKSVLLPAKQYCLQLVYLSKRKEIEQIRTQQAQQVFDHISQLFKNDEVGILEVNKAKISWIQEQFKVAEIENEQQNILLVLQNMNGGTEVVFQPSEYEMSLELAHLDSIWSQKKESDPELKKLDQQEQVALQKLKLSKNKRLPKLTAGYNYQGVSGSNYSGVYGGISIPLWSNRSKVKSAATEYQFQQSFSNAELLNGYTIFQKRYNDYQVLKSKFLEYESTLSGLSSEAMLLNAYHLGEISFMEYFIELRFYREAIDSMLEMEVELYELQAILLDYQL